MADKRNSPKPDAKASAGQTLVRRTGKSEQKKLQEEATPVLAELPENIGVPATHAAHPRPVGLPLVRGLPPRLGEQHVAAAGGVEGSFLRGVLLEVSEARKLQSAPSAGPDPALQRRLELQRRTQAARRAREGRLRQLAQDREEHRVEVARRLRGALHQGTCSISSSGGTTPTASQTCADWPKRSSGPGTSTCSKPRRAQTCASRSPRTSGSGGSWTTGRWRRAWARGSSRGTSG